MAGLRAAAASAALLWAVAAPLASAESVEVHNGVYLLKGSTFEAMLRKYPTVMVKFYTPGCEPCKAMASAYEKAAKKVKKEAVDSGLKLGPRLAQVDAGAEKQLAEKYGVKSHPTILIFRNGEFFSSYFGGLETADFVDFMGTFSQAPPLGAALRASLVAQGAYRDAVRAHLPAEYQAPALVAFPAAAALPVALIGALLLCLCRRRRAGPPAPAAARGRATEAAGKRPGGRSTTPGPPRKAEESRGEAEKGSPSAGAGGAAGVKKAEAEKKRD